MFCLLYHIPFALEVSNIGGTYLITWLNASFGENSYQHWALPAFELKLSLVRPYHHLGEKGESDRLQELVSCAVSASSFLAY